ncbi:Uncharacterised protein [Vibrio cholerae]|nr:Uncharacterised protein [Vibrio cholerae]
MNLKCVLIHAVFLLPLSKPMAVWWKIRVGRFSWIA